MNSETQDNPMERIENNDDINEEYIIDDTIGIDGDGSDDEEFYREIIEENDILVNSDGHLVDFVDEDLETTMKLVEKKKKEAEEQDELDYLRSSISSSPKPQLIKKPEVCQFAM